LLFLYDVNGDGYPDIVYSNSGVAYVAFGSASGYGSPVAIGVSSGSTLLVGRVLGTNQDDVLADTKAEHFFAAAPQEKPGWESGADRRRWQKNGLYETACESLDAMGIESPGWCAGCVEGQEIEGIAAAGCA
jgi:hypothetical protein